MQKAVWSFVIHRMKTCRSDLLLFTEWKPAGLIFHYSQNENLQVWSFIIRRMKTCRSDLSLFAEWKPAGLILHYLQNEKLQVWSFIICRMKTCRATWIPGLKKSLKVLNIIHIHFSPDKTCSKFKTPNLPYDCYQYRGPHMQIHNGHRLDNRAGDTEGQRK